MTGCRRPARCGASLSAAIVLAAACGGRADGPGTGATTGAASGARHVSAPTPTIHLAQSTISFSVVTHLAEARGFFRSEGLTVVPVNVQTGPEVVTQLRSTASDAPQAGTIALTPVVTMAAAGAEPVVLATTVSSRSAARLVTYRGAGITASPATPRGKRVGVIRNTNGDIYLSRLLAKGHLTERDVTLVNARPADLVSFLVAGELDAVVLWDPFVAQARRRSRAAGAGSGRSDTDLVVLVDSTLHHLEFNVVTTRERLATARDALARVLRACIRAERYIREHPVQAQAETERWLGLEAGDLGEFFRTTEFRVHLDTTGIRERLAEELAWLRHRDPSTVQSVTDLAPYADASVLRAVDSTRLVP